MVGFSIAALVVAHLHSELAARPDMMWTITAMPPNEACLTLMAPLH